MANTKKTTLTPEQKKAREARWWEIRGIVQARGEVTDPSEIDDIVDAIEEFEWGGPHEGTNHQRRHVTDNMLSGGYVKMRDIVEKANEVWDRPFKFDEPTPEKTEK